jgi:hypothetical protein
VTNTKNNVSDSVITISNAENNDLKPSPDGQVLSDIVMPYRSTFFPLGFPLEIITNSPDVLEAAEQSWGKFLCRFDAPPLLLRLGVTSHPQEYPSPPPAPLCRIQGHLLSHIADQYNFLSCDLNSGFAFGWVTEKTAKSVLYLRYHILEAAALSMLAATHASALHAACVTSHGLGMLLCGDSGAGKSSLAFAGARSGWAFTCDDASYLLFDRNVPLIAGNCYQFRLRDSGTQLFPELDGRPITPRAAGKPSLEIPTAELPDIVTSESAHVQVIIFLNRREVTSPKLVPFSKDQARSWFKQSHFIDIASTARHLAAINTLLEVPIYELQYTDLDWAIERLDRLAQQGC